ncbi:MAG: formate dehydrogenase subunit alpha [Sphingobacteriales bacterium]|jgi:formate dehydrogenase major subunit|nr:formate dehydrogenase subunit alpha [Sphingobacteriales bacterium]MBP9140200.1 formate dehydrogenase subunit alpha [Chitinophagales bacterium]MDA0197666.1 formate dehydrogenase subunit alpha [Bacteroidota bacterium]MBK7528523.1 formate dehydrogenase subunit alpha [Sphingobacteriales bacterium]MBL0246618.1 formate dehydrogenase subunit alpha [Sphingobacteriales bacterium]
MKHILRDKTNDNIQTNTKSQETATKNAYIDGRLFPIYEGETILSFVRRNLGNELVPTLCDAPNLEPFGACRVCSVEVALTANGPVKTQASCHTPVIPGSYIYTSSDSVLKLRKNIIELVLTDHPLDCLTCEVNNNCELQSVAAKVGIRDVRYPEGKNHLDRKKDLSHPYMTSDMSKCISCYRCVRACDEVQGQFVLSMAGRGFDNRIIKGSDVSFFESDCVSCGACAQACPTSAISDVFESKSVVGVQKTRTVCTYCGVGCNLEVATINNKVKSIQAPYDAPVNSGHTCLKGRFAFSFYNHPERLRTPYIRKNGVLEPASWDEALDFIAFKLKEIIANHGADAIGFISSARGTNEENYLMQKLARAVIGTNNIDCCARVCHSPTAMGMQRTYGTGAATNSIIDLQYTNCIMVVGANPTDAHPVTGAKMKQFAMKGNTTIVIDPRRTELAKYATYHLQLKPGTNVALLNMLLYYIVAEGLEDENFIKNRTVGYEEMKNQILTLDINELANITGVDKDLVREAAIAYATAPNAMSFHGLGVTEHSQGTFTVMQIADLAMITGNIGRRGVGVNPLRGQNNVQGAADMGCQPHQGAGYLDAYNPEINKKYELHYGTKVPLGKGLKIPEMFMASIMGKLKGMWLMGEDIAQTDPNTCHVINALEQLDLLVIQEIFMTETCKWATVVLPATSFLEKSGTFTNGERRIQRVQAVVDPLPGTKPDGQIIVEVMRRMGFDQPDYNPEMVLEEVSRIVPFFAGVTWERLGNAGLQWPVKPDGTETEVLHTEEFKLGKGVFHYQHWRESEELQHFADDYPFIITTNRELEHYNAGTMTRRTKNVEILGQDVLMIHPIDAAAYNIEMGDKVYVESPRGHVIVKAKITDEVLPGILSSTFHFPEVMLNRITSNISDSETMCPEFKVVACKISKLTT